MARFCYFWSMTPEEFHRLRWDEYQAMVGVMQEINESRKKR